MKSPSQQSWRGDETTSRRCHRQKGQPRCDSLSQGLSALKILRNGPFRYTSSLLFSPALSSSKAAKVHQQAQGGAVMSLQGSARGLHGTHAILVRCGQSQPCGCALLQELPIGYGAAPVPAAPDPYHLPSAPCSIVTTRGSSPFERSWSVCYRLPVQTAPFIRLFRKVGIFPAGHEWRKAPLEPVWEG